MKAAHQRAKSTLHVYLMYLCSREVARRIVMAARTEAAEKIMVVMMVVVVVVVVGVEV